MNDIASWDPMREHFYDEDAHSYEFGPGSRLPKHQQLPNIRKGVSLATKLYVFPLKEGYTKAALDNIFSKYGEVIDVYIHHNDKWAFVTMKTPSAADRAIRDLNKNPDLEFKVNYAREKSDSASVAASVTGSLSEMDRRENEDINQARRQSIDSSKRKSITDRGSLVEQNAPEKLERFLNNFQFSENLFPVSEKRFDLNGRDQKPAITHRDITSQPLPCCFCCNHQTLETCTKCSEPFCSKLCMIRGYEGHTNQCILVPPHSSEQKIRNKVPSMNNHTPSVSTNLANSSRNYLDRRNQLTVDVNNSRKYDGINDLGADSPNNNSQNIHHRRSAATYKSRAFETNSPFLNDLSKQSDNFEMNGHHPSENSGRIIEDEAFIGFDTKSRKKNHYVRKERVHTSNDSNLANEVIWNTEIQESGNRSKWENKPARNHHRLNKENEFGDSKSQASGYHSKKENTSSRDNRSRVSGNHLRNENDSSWDTQSQVSEYHSKRRITSSGDNQSQISRNRPNRKSDSSQVNGYHSNTENTSFGDYQSRTSKHFKNRSSIDARITDDESRSKPRPRSDISPLGLQRKFNFTSPKKSNLSSLYRADVKENSKFEVKLAEGGPLAVLIQQEMPSLNSMIDHLQEYSLEPMEKISKGWKCVAKKTPDDYGTWYRALIHEVDPLLVKFIDFSYEPVKVREEDVRIVPVEFTSINPFCYAVNFENASIDEVSELKNSTFEVVFLSKDYNVWNVNLIKKPYKEDLQNANKQSESHRKSHSFNQSLADWKIILEKDVPLEVVVTYIDRSSGKIFVTISNKVSKLQDLISNSNHHLPELEEFRINTTCLAFFEDAWYRAKIVSVNPLEVYYIDFGNVATAKKSDLKVLPDELKTIDPLVVPVKFRNGSKSSVSSEETIVIIPIEESAAERLWIVRLVTEPVLLEKPNAVSKSTNEFDDKSYAPKVAVGNVLEVQVTYSVSNTEYYVGPNNMLESLNITYEDVLKSSSLETPSVGTLCVRNYDGLWCRAKIVELEPLTIYYIDFGNEEKVDIEDLYPLPKKFQTTPPMAFKIHLQEPQTLPQYKSLILKKVSEKFWTVVDKL